MIAAGTINYQLGTAPVTRCGILCTGDVLDAALTSPIANIILGNEKEPDDHVSTI